MKKRKLLIGFNLIFGFDLILDWIQFDFGLDSIWFLDWIGFEKSNQTKVVLVGLDFWIWLDFWIEFDLKYQIKPKWSLWATIDVHEKVAILRS